MYKVLHPTYQEAWGETATFDEIQAKLGLDKERTEMTIEALINLGSLEEQKPTTKTDLDLNKDGKVDEKDFSKAAKILNTAKKTK